MRSKIFFTAIFCGFAFLLQAQTLERSVVSNAGQELKSSGINLEFTIGELVVGQSSQGAVNLSQGFNQATAKKPGSVSGINGTSLKLYPNPAGDRFFVSIDKACVIQVISSTGAVVYTSDLKGGSISQIDCKEWSGGVYQVVLTDRSGARNSSRFVKI